MLNHCFYRCWHVSLFVVLLWYRYLLRNVLSLDLAYPLFIVGAIGMFVTIFLTMCTWFLLFLTEGIKKHPGDWIILVLFV